MRIATVDLLSNTCFPLLAADELGLFKAEGLDVSIELLPAGVQALRTGDVELLAMGAVYDILREFPGWKGAKLVVALSQGTPWLLVVRADLAAKQGDLSAITAQTVGPLLRPFPGSRPDAPEQLNQRQEEEP